MKFIATMQKCIKLYQLCRFDNLEVSRVYLKILIENKSITIMKFDLELNDNSQEVTTQFSITTLPASTNRFKVQNQDFLISWIKFSVALIINCQYISYNKSKLIYDLNICRITDCMHTCLRRWYLIRIYNNFRSVKRTWTTKYR